MDFGKMTLAELWEFLGAFKALTAPTTLEHPFTVGKNWFIRTVTHHLTGKLIRVTATELVMVDAAWIPDDGRFHQAISGGILGEIEPYPDGLEVVIGRGSIVDACEWRHALPRVQK